MGKKYSKQGKIEPAKVTARTVARWLNSSRQDAVITCLIIPPCVVTACGLILQQFLFHFCSFLAWISREGPEGKNNLFATDQNL